MLLTVDPLVTLISSPYFGQCQNEFIRYDHKADLFTGWVTPLSPLRFTGKPDATGIPGETPTGRNV